MEIYGLTRLWKPEDWRAAVGEGKWKVGRSAERLAHTWHSARGDFPASVRRLLATDPLLASMRPVVGFVEMPTVLDTAKAPSMTDLLVRCRNPEGDTLAIAIEAKVDETFDYPICDWIRKNNLDPDTPAPSRRRRLQFLADRLKIRLPEDSLLRYQLVHRTAAALIEAESVGARACLMLVHSFAANGDEQNWNDFVAFADAFGLEAERGKLLGPVRDDLLYLAWISESSA